MKKLFLCKRKCVKDAKVWNNCGSHTLLEYILISELKSKNYLYNGTD